MYHQFCLRKRDTKDCSQHLDLFHFSDFYLILYFVQNFSLSFFYRRHFQLTNIASVSLKQFKSFLLIHNRRSNSFNVLFLLFRDRDRFSSSQKSLHLVLAKSHLRSHRRKTDLKRKIRNKEKVKRKQNLSFVLEQQSFWDEVKKKFHPRTQSKMLFLNIFFNHQSKVIYV